jgi:GNAT superfamily N-acetyltransferase
MTEDARRPAIRIRSATEADVPLLLTFIRELAQYEKAPERVSTNEERLQGTLFGSRPYAEAVIAFQDSSPVAFAIYYFTYQSSVGLPGLYLEDILVREAWRGAGVGRQMLGFLARQAIEHGCGRMEWSVLNWNKLAMGFYEKLGAEPMRDWTVFRFSKDKLKELASESSHPEA